MSRSELWPGLSGLCGVSVLRELPTTSCQHPRLGLQCQEAMGTTVL